jgi:hypothetical protein
MMPSAKAALGFGVATLAMFALALAGCAAVQATVKTDLAAILATCEQPAVAAEKADVLSIVQDIVEGNAPNFKDQLAKQEAIAQAGVLCALQQIVNGGVSAAPAVRALSASPTTLLGRANAQAYLNAHK